MNIEIKRENRKTILLKLIDYQNAVLKIPFYLSDKKVEDFLESKKTWIEKNSIKLKSNTLFSQQFDLKSKLYLNGEYFQEVIKLKSHANNKIKNFYKSQFFILEEMAKKLSVQTGLKYKDIKMHSSVRVWGSNNSQGLMKLNYKLIILPPILQKYVILHELCHSKQMNHSPKFWALVQKLCPEFKILKKQLNNFSFLLKEKF